ncbi:MAG: hypothetical protein ABWY95_00760 [Thermoleophilaceae bacterium]
MLGQDEAEELRDLVRIVTEDPLRGAPEWALRRFELGCAQPAAADALSDYLLALRSLMDATSDAGEASLALRVAALCAEEGQRRTVQRRIELAVSLERFAMHGGGHLDAELRDESAPELVSELEGHLRALLRDMLCGYLDADLKGVADDILLEAREPFEIAAKDMRVEAMVAAVVEASSGAPVPEAPPSTAAREAPPEREWFEEPLAEEVPARHPVDELYDDEEDTAEVPALAVAPPVMEDEITVHRIANRFAAPVEDPPVVEAPPVDGPEQQSFEGVTPSADWGSDDPEDFSAPV